MNNSFFVVPLLLWIPVVSFAEDTEKLEGEGCYYYQYATKEYPTHDVHALKRLSKELYLTNSYEEGWSYRIKPSGILSRNRKIGIEFHYRF